MSITLAPDDGINYLEPWEPADVDFTGQLAKEMYKGHILYGKKVKTIARRQDNDDVLFEVTDAAFKYAVVHLTWTTNNYEGYPRTKVFSSWAEVYEKCIVEDNTDWS